MTKMMKNKIKIKNKMKYNKIERKSIIYILVILYNIF